MARKRAGLTVAEAAGGRDGTAAEAAATAPTPTPNSPIVTSHIYVVFNTQNIINWGLMIKSGNEQSCYKT